MKYSVTSLLFLVLSFNAVARNVDLSTVPQRDTVQLTIYNSEDLTLVRETRRVSFKKGINPLQFSWANTLIDPTSVELRFLSHPAQLEVLDTTFPHDKPQMLYWQVNSGHDGDALLEITYFTSGISWQADYVAIAGEDEKDLYLESFVKIINYSGEAYENAQVRLVVGTLNLVEKIAQLASSPPVMKPRSEKRDNLRRQAAKAVMMEEMTMSAGAAAPAYDDMAEQKAVEKESLSEYFIYTIEGTESIPDGWAKRLRSFEAKAVPFSVQYRYRPREYGAELVRMYLLTNDKDSQLGTTPLPEGTIRIFRDNGRDGLSYLAQQNLKYVPIGDKIELNLGTDPNVIFELITLKIFRDELWMRVRGGKVFRKVGGVGLQIESDSQVAGWNEHTVYNQRIRNYSGKDIEVEIRRTYDGDTIFRSQLEPELHDFRTVQFTTQVKAGEKTTLLHEVITKQGKNALKDNVELLRGKVTF